MLKCLKIDDSFISNLQRIFNTYFPLNLFYNIPPLLQLILPNKPIKCLYYTTRKL